MPTTLALIEPDAKVIVGVDTHKLVHVAVAINMLGARLATISVSADRAGYGELIDWARTLGIVEAFGIEGTGSYGVGLASFARRHDVRVVEVNHCDRRKRRNNGKSDTIDAETAARSVLAGISTAVPKTADGASDMVRQIKIARDTAVKARSSAIVTLKTLIVNATGERHCCVDGSLAVGEGPDVKRRRRPSTSSVDLSAFAGFRFPPEAIMLAVRWYLRFGLSYRDLEELLAERGIDVDHVTLFRWVQRFAV